MQCLAAKQQQKQKLVQVWVHQPVLSQLKLAKAKLAKLKQQQIAEQMLFVRGVKPARMEVVNPNVRLILIVGLHKFAMQQEPVLLKQPVTVKQPLPVVAVEILAVRQANNVVVDLSQIVELDTCVHRVLACKVAQERGHPQPVLSQPKLAKAQLAKLRRQRIAERMLFVQRCKSAREAVLQEPKEEYL